MKKLALGVWLGILGWGFAQAPGVAPSPDGKADVRLSQDGSTVELFSPSSGATLLQVDPNARGSVGYGAAWTPDGGYAVVTTNFGRATNCHVITRAGGSWRIIPDNVTPSLLAATVPRDWIRSESIAVDKAEKDRFECVYTATAGERKATYQFTLTVSPSGAKATGWKLLGVN